MLRWLKNLLQKRETERMPACSSRDTESDNEQRDAFRFSPELFEVRTDVIDELRVNRFVHSGDVKTFCWAGSVQ